MLPDRHVVHPTDATRESGRWSHASVVTMGHARLIFVAGQTARQQDGTPIGPDFEAQFRLVYDNLNAVLRAAGAEFSHIVSMRTFMTRRADVPTFRALRDRAHDSLFPHGNHPPNALVLVEGLAEADMLLEIEAIAVVPA
jgi:enamine deaminase RidA (YjgF/YER057c/UK114 family)